MCLFEIIVGDIIVKSQSSISNLDQLFLIVVRDVDMPNP